MTTSMLTQGEQQLLTAQKQAKQLFDHVRQQGLIQPGQTERDVSDAIFRLAEVLFGVKKYWHKRIVRTGQNTLLSYQHNPPNRIIEADDILFLDFGPVFEEYEADFGYTVVLGNDPIKRRLKEDTEKLFHQIKSFYCVQPDLTGKALYQRVITEAHQLGWVFGNTHCGHIVGKFPHETRLGDDRTLYLCEENDTPLNHPVQQERQHWILEIHLTDPERQIGGFYEDLLTLTT